MGCCLTITAAANNFQIHLKTRDTSPPMPPGSGEETVKEVLSEAPKKLLATNSISSKITPSLHSEDEFKSKDVVVQMTKHPVEKTASEEVSSEVYSYSSAATTTTLGTGIDVDAHGEVTQKLNNPPPVKMVSKTQPTLSSTLRARRPPSPARRPAVRSTDKNPQQKSRTAQRKRNVVSSNVVEHKPALRRSRPPALRWESGQLTVKNSCKRVPLNVRKNEIKVEVKKANDVGVMPVLVPVPETSESLENPFVSLECFIFL